MKKTVLLGLFVILQTFVFMSCEQSNSNSTLYAQSSNDAQRIVGTWSTEDGTTTITFNANGTVTTTGNRVVANGDYMVANSKLITHSRGSDYAEIRDYFISANGRILVISRSSDNLWLIKQ